MDIALVYPNHRIRVDAMRQFCQYYAAMAPESKIKVNKIHHFLKIDLSEIYFLTDDEYEIWCKGRSYIYHGIPYHSGYPIKKENKCQESQ